MSNTRPRPYRLKIRPLLNSAALQSSPLLHINYNLVKAPSVSLALPFSLSIISTKPLFHISHTSFLVKMSCRSLYHIYHISVSHTLHTSFFLFKCPLINSLIPVGQPDPGNHTKTTAITKAFNFGGRNV